MASKGVEASDIPKEERGRRETRGGARWKRRSRAVSPASQDVTTAFEGRLAKRGLATGDVHEQLVTLNSEEDGGGTVEPLEGKLQGAFDSFMANISRAVEELQGSLASRGGRDKPHRTSNPCGGMETSRDGSGERPKRKQGCFLCGGPHWMRECPQWNKLNAIISALGEEPQARELRLGAMTVFNSIVAQKASGGDAKANGAAETSLGKTYKYVSVEIKGQSVPALLDSGADQSLIVASSTGELGLPCTKEHGWVKVVDQPSQPIHSVARGVPVQIGSWSGEIDLHVVPMKDFKMVLGRDFINRMLPFTFTRDGRILFEDGAETRPDSGVQAREGSGHGIVRTRLAAEARWGRGTDLQQLAKKIEALDTSSLDEGVKGFGGGECHGARVRGPKSRPSWHGAAATTPMGARAGARTRARARRGRHGVTVETRRRMWEQPRASI
ncbi:hypothetical protein SLEP1_g53815 [Rubroshorea leprosula]|uniref:Peptidase A2 domain-containing protein n=1 Tax=Rubroshorea leprosula TaxID=152421 RepID=A0AAV5MCV7_9ROSI|nr:hypothetical protein SLEP1_g53815 [Rubroshorea leprosula]